MSGEGGGVLEYTRESLRDICVCVCVFRPRVRERKEESDFDEIGAWKYEFHAWISNE